jgi:hypothetical protein
MADSSPLADLLDRAKELFSLANELGNSLQQEAQEQRRPTHAKAWKRRETLVDPFHAGLLRLRDAMEDLPEDFMSITQPLLDAISIVEKLQDDLQETNGDIADFQDLSCDLIAVSQSGLEAVKQVSKAHPLDDLPEFDEPKEEAPEFSLLDRYPVTPIGHIEFLEFVRDEVNYAADAKRQQLERQYEKATIESMVRGVYWAEASRRFAALSDLPEMIRSDIHAILRRQLTAGTVEQIDELLTPAIRRVRDWFEGTRFSNVISKHVVVNTVGYLWNAYRENKHPCSQTSGLTIESGEGTPTIASADGAAEANRTALDRVQALVTAEGGDKAEATERLIAKVQLREGMDKASVLDMPLVDFAAAAMGYSAAGDSRSESTTAAHEGTGSHETVRGTGDGQPRAESLGMRTPQHSDDFTSVDWYGQHYTFTRTQADCVREMWGNWERGTPSLKQRTILDGAESSNTRLRDVFRKKGVMHPAWGIMIVKTGRGCFGLSEPQDADTQKKPTRNPT